MPIGTPFHERTLALCSSLNYREWSGYYAVSSYETHLEHEYNAIRHAAAVIDISPLYKYVVAGPDAARLIDRVVTRDVDRLAVGQVMYTPWCDEAGRVIDDGTVARLEEQRFRWTSAEPTLRWIQQNAAGLDATIHDVSERTAALALQGPTSAGVLRACADVDIDALKYFGIARGHIVGVTVEISRTGYTGDLGYEIWIPADSALSVWDRLMEAGRSYGIAPVGLLALDVARVEAGLLLLDVDFISSRKAMTADQQYTPFEMGLGRLVDLAKPAFTGRAALAAAATRGPRHSIVGLDVSWTDVERLHERVGLVPVAPAAASRTAVPVLRRGRQVGRATTTTWSPALKRLIALATIDAAHATADGVVDIEVTVNGHRHTAGATVVKTPFFSPARKTALPPP